MAGTIGQERLQCLHIIEKIHVLESDASTQCQEIVPEKLLNLQEDVNPTLLKLLQKSIMSPE